MPDTFMWNTVLEVRRHFAAVSATWVIHRATSMDLFSFQGFKSPRVILAVEFSFSILVFNCGPLHRSSERLLPDQGFNQ
jgi:hypothetical protein